jgi:hypothetical protein
VSQVSECGGELGELDGSVIVFDLRMLWCVCPMLFLPSLFMVPASPFIIQGGLTYKG